MVHVADCSQRFAEIDIGQRIHHSGDDGDVALDVRPAIQRLHINKVGAGRARPKVRPAGADADVMLWVSVAGIEGKAARRHPEGFLDQVGGDAHPFAIHPGPCFLEYVAGFFVLDVETGVF